MRKIVLFIIFNLLSAVYCTEPGKPKPRLLFYDEDGNLVKTYSNPYLQNLRLNAGLPIYGNFLNPFFGYIKDFGSIFAFTVPVSNQVIQQIKENPQYHNQLMVVPTKDPAIEPNPLCNGRRAQIPSPNLCNNYLNCWDGWAVEQECPTGLLFSRQGYCDYSDNVNCETRKLKEQPQISIQPRCDKDFETFRNQLNCNEFFVCVNRQPVKFNCPADLVYNQYLGVCDYPTRVDCRSPVTHLDSFTNKVSSTAPSVFNPSTTSSILSSSVPDPIGSPVDLPLKPSASAPPAVPQIPDVPTIPAAPALSPIPLPPAALKPEDIQTIYTENSIVNTQSWTSTHIATSLQDAIQQLQKGNLAKITV